MTKIEFYIGDADRYIAVIDAHAVPRNGEYISICGVTYNVLRVTWAIDAIERMQERKLRACVVLEEGC